MSPLQGLAYEADCIKGPQHCHCLQNLTHKMPQKMGKCKMRKQLLEIKAKPN